MRSPEHPPGQTRAASVATAQVGAASASEGPEHEASDLHLCEVPKAPTWKKRRMLSSLTRLSDVCALAQVDSSFIRTTRNERIEA